MKKFYLFSLFLFITSLFCGCFKDSDCLFVGGFWCADPLGIVCEEYRANGEYYLTGAYVYNWQAKDDCSIIEFYNPFVGGQKLAEKRIISISGNSSGSTMVWKQGSATMTYTKQ
jgi:hypothetical protein